MKTKKKLLSITAALLGALLVSSVCNSSSKNFAKLFSEISNVEDREEMEKLSGLLFIMKYATSKNKPLSNASVNYFSTVEYDGRRYHLLELSYLGIATRQNAVVIFQECEDVDEAVIIETNATRFGYVDSFEGKVADFIAFENDLCSD